MKYITQVLIEIFVFSTHCKISITLTAVVRLLISVDDGLLVGSAEETGPIDGVIVAQITIVCYVDVACTDMFQGLEL